MTVEQQGCGQHKFHHQPAPDVGWLLTRMVSTMNTLDTFNAKLLFCVLVAALFSAGCGQNQRAADIREVKRLGQKFRDNIENGLDKNDAASIQDIALVSALFAKETSLIEGVQWTERYKPTAKGYTSGTGQAGLVSVDIWKDRIRTLVLNPDVPVSDVTPEEYLGYIKQVFSEEDIKKLEAIRERTKCWEKFRRQLESDRKKE